MKGPASIITGMGILIMGLNYFPAVLCCSLASQHLMPSVMWHPKRTSAGAEPDFRLPGLQSYKLIYFN